MSEITVVDALTADGHSMEYTAIGGVVQWQVHGVFSDGTVAFEVKNKDHWSPDVHAASPVDGPAVNRVPLVSGTKFRFGLADATASPDTNVSITFVQERARA